MGTWGSFFAAITAPLARRVMLALGIGLVTFAGLSVVESQIASSVGAAWSGIAADAYSVLVLGGWVDAVATWLSAVATVVAWMALGRLAPIPGGASS